MTTEIVSILNDLIGTSKEGDDGFSLAVRDTNDPELISVFTEGARSCQAAATELQRQVRALGGREETGDGAKSAVRRGWIRLGSAATGRDTTSILEECERAEDYARTLYRDALEHELPETLRSLVQRQYQDVIANHDRVRELRERYRARSDVAGMEQAANNKVNLTHRLA